jgi:predicted RecA/RadA family phage recombinase
MKTFQAKGDIVTLTADRALAQGDGLLVGAIFAAACDAAANGAQVECIRFGVVTMTTLSTDTGAIGAKMYWDNTNKRLTTTVGSNTLVGALMAAKTAGQTTSTVVLDGTIR